MIDVAIVIPLYNEEACVPSLVMRLTELRSRLVDREESHHFIVVNDGSTDGSLAALEKSFAGWENLEIVSHDVNRGFGAAIRTGLEKARASWVATVDADTNYDAREIPVLLDAARARQVDLVTVSPWHPEGSRKEFPLHRFIFSIGVAWLYALVLAPVGRSIYTYTAGFRVYRGDRLPEILPQSTDFVATAELFVNAILAGWTWSELPWKVANREHGYSKLKTMKTIRGHFSHMFRIVMRRLRSRA